MVGVGQALVAWGWQRPGPIANWVSREGCELSVREMSGGYDSSGLVSACNCVSPLPAREASELAGVRRAPHYHNQLGYLDATPHRPLKGVAHAEKAAARKRGDNYHRDCVTPDAHDVATATRPCAKEKCITSRALPRRMWTAASRPTRCRPKTGPRAPYGAGWQSGWLPAVADATAEILVMTQSAGSGPGPCGRKRLSVRARCVCTACAAAGPGCGKDAKSVRPSPTGLGSTATNS